jgi:hypothetical protein
MKDYFRNPRADLPHPLVILVAGLILAGYWMAGFHSGWEIPRAYHIAFLAAFLLGFRWVSRWSARRMKARRLERMRKLAETSMLHLND